MTTATKDKIKEARKSAFREGSSQTGQRREVVIIEAGWGSSGYYSEDVLSRDIPRIFPVGTHMYLDHPTESEDVQRPERTVKDLVGVLVEAPRMAGIQSVAIAEIFEHWVPVIDALAEHIGLSIRALGISSPGSAAGKDGSIVDALTEGISIDYVTKAGAGGKIGPIIESAREKSLPHVLEEARNAGNHFEARIHRDFTNHADHLYGEGHLTRDERITLSKGIGDALDSFASTVQADAPQLYERDPYSELDEAESRYIESKINGRSGDPIQEATMPDDSGLSELRKEFDGFKESMEGRVKEAEDRAKKAEDDLAESKRESDARKERETKEGAIRLVDESLSKVDGLPDKAKERIIESVTSGDLPERDGSLDKGVLEERTRARLREEAEYLGESLKIGQVSGAGSSDDSFFSENGGNGGGGEGNKEDKLVQEFKESGLSESAAKVAARGR